MRLPVIIINDCWEYIIELEYVCMYVGNSAVADVQFGHLFLVYIKYDALQKVTSGLFRTICIWVIPVETASNGKDNV